MRCGAGRTLPVRAATCTSTHVRHSRRGRVLRGARARAARRDADFVDGVVFAPDALYLNVGRFADEAPAASDYTYRVDLLPLDRARKHEDYLTTHDYLWRWDTDWFWCSKNVGAQNPLVRRLLGRGGSARAPTTQIMRWNSRVERHRAGSTAWRHGHRESVIQDVDIPLDARRRFPRFLRSARCGICAGLDLPASAPGPTPTASRSIRCEPGALYVNFGFWDVVRTRERASAGPLQPPDRGRSRRAGRHQVAVLGELLRPRRVRRALRRRRPTAR